MKLTEERVRALALQKKRIDGRKDTEFRKVTIEKNPFGNAEGSARVRIGETDVIAGVKMEVGKPFPDKLDEGVLMVGAEFSPLASSDFETGPPGEASIELARVVDRGIRESKAIDTKKLCIEEGEKVWMIFLDVQIVNHAGNLIDAAALAGISALLNAKMPEYDGEKLNYDKRKEKLPMTCKPIAVTVSKINDMLFVDPAVNEENARGAMLVVTTKDNENICALQKSGSGYLTLDEIEKAVEMSIKIGKELRKLV